MTWFNILKMPNPHGGKWKDLTRDEYYEMDDVDKKRYQYAMGQVADKEVKIAVLPRRAGQAPPKTDDQIRELRELSRFHHRQVQRIKNNSKRGNFYSEEDENNRRGHVGIFDAVDLREQTTQEIYDNYSREDKITYWSRLGARQHRFKQLNPTSNVKHVAGAEEARMRKNPNYTAPFDPEKSKSNIELRDSMRRDISEYDDFTPEEKRKYHSRYKARANRDGNKKMQNWHHKMQNRITINSKLPTYATPEEEQ